MGCGPLARSRDGGHGGARQRELAKGFVYLACHPEPVKKHGELPGDRDDGTHVLAS